MNSEIAVLRGRLAAANESLKLLEIGVDCDIGIVRGTADKYADKEDLQVEAMVAAAERIRESVAKIRTLNAIAASLKKDLGEA